VDLTEESADGIQEHRGKIQNKRSQHPRRNNGKQIPKKRDLPTLENPVQCQNFDSTWTCASFFPTSASSYYSTITHPDAAYTTMAQSHKQPLELDSRQRHKYTGDFKAKPIYQSKKPV
jgi:hypothetical protein